MSDDWVFDLQGKEVVFTGGFDGYSKAELAVIAKSLGADRVKAWVSDYSTDVLVRGWSSRWSYGNYGEKEQLAAKLQARGHHIQIIDLEGFLNLRSGLPAPSLPPNARVSPALRSAAEGGALGAPYLIGRNVATVSGDGDYFRDPEKMDRGLRGHFETQDALARHLVEQALEPLQPFDPRCNFDLAWYLPAEGCGIAEIKSLTDSNEAFQVRHGLGQILDYGHRARMRGYRPQLYLVLERKPVAREHWVSLCKSCTVTLSWAPDFEGLP